MGILDSSGYVSKKRFLRTLYYVLQIKRATLNRALKKVVNIIKHNRPGKWTDHMENMASDHEGCICPLADMKPSVGALC